VREVVQRSQKFSKTNPRERQHLSEAFPIILNKASPVNATKSVHFSIESFHWNISVKHPIIFAVGMGDDYDVLFVCRFLT
jgi:hypothetical protein